MARVLKWPPRVRAFFGSSRHACFYGDITFNVFYIAKSLSLHLPFIVTPIKAIPIHSKCLIRCPTVFDLSYSGFRVVHLSLQNFVIAFVHGIFYIRRRRYYISNARSLLFPFVYKNHPCLSFVIKRDTPDKALNEIFSSIFIGQVFWYRNGFLMKAVFGNQ